MTKDKVWFGPKTVNKKTFLGLKYFLLAYLSLVLIFEILWTVYITEQFYQDLLKYDWEEIWIKEFYKSTKNFFIFTAILVVLSLLLGIAATYTNNRSLLLVFLVGMAAEWTFELVGIYASHDKNVVIYKLIPATLRPLLVILSLVFYSKLRAMGGGEHSAPMNGPS
ncbi:hypothetical protein HDE_07762 [Halotydeus destructor]|nr:hypothetical protein HDE_07762 [Halotydeus destructor]